MNLSSFIKFLHKMSSSNFAVLAPVGVRGMTVLEREKFLRNFKVPVLKVKEENLSKIIAICKSYYLKLDAFKPVQTSEEDFKKHIYLNPEKIMQWSDLDEKHREALSKQNINENNLIFREVQLGYDNWSYDTIFKAVLPVNVDIVSGFSQIGHIIHLNLRDHLLEYRPLIGQVLLDKIKNCRTVVNKSNTIDNTYRNFSMEVIAGEEDFLVTVKENNCIFKFDFSKVYWNPRLGKEHERILGYFKPNDILFDVFCGVGPFSIPATRKQCQVFANDLNPDSYKWLNYNAEKNYVSKRGQFKSFNKDGKDFILENFKEFIMDYCKGNVKISTDNKIHITMNLPAMALEFLKYFKGLIDDEKLMDKFNCEVIIYVYCFANEDSVSVAKKLVNENFDCDMSPYIIDVFNVRKVSPKKDMMRVTIKLTKEILFSKSDDCEPPVKKLCIEQP